MVVKDDAADVDTLAKDMEEVHLLEHVTSLEDESQQGQKMEEVLM